MPEMRMLWYSVLTPQGVKEQRLPDNEGFFTPVQWRQYQELSELAAAYNTTVVVSSKSLTQ